jgi:hypothetical protein
MFSSATSRGVVAMIPMLIDIIMHMMIFELFIFFTDYTEAKAALSSAYGTFLFQNGTPVRDQKTKG